MALLGKAAVAMWWDMAAATRPEFEDWHSHEHFPERMGIPGFLRGSRWASAEGHEGFFVLYELAAYETLTSDGYLARLNDPTPWSKKLMPQHRNMVRSQCRIVGSHGGGIARAMLTLRLSPAAGRAQTLRDHLEDRLAALPARPGLTGAHLLWTQTPAIAPTLEQRIRGGADQAADWIVLVAGYDPGRLQALAAGELGPTALDEAGAAVPRYGLYDLSHTVTPADM